MNKSLPERAFPLQDEDLERTKLFVRKNVPGAPRVLLAMRDPGEANALLPVVEELKRDRLNLAVLTDSRAQEALIQANLGFNQRRDIDPLLWMARNRTRPDLILSGVAMYPGSELAVTANAQFDQTPVIWLSDYIGGSILKIYRDKSRIPVSVSPDYLCVANEWVREQELKNLLPGLKPEKVLVTGQPAFDKIALEDHTGIKRDFREKYNLDDQSRVITYVGTMGEASADALGVLVNGLAEVSSDDYRLVIRRHPRDSVTMADYLDIAGPLEGRILDTTGTSTDQVITASDLVVNTLSTAGMEALYRGVPVIHIWIEDILKKSELGEEGMPPVPPYVEDGASPAIFSSAQAGSVLEQVLSDQSYQKQLRAKMASWQVDGQAAKKVANLARLILMGN